MLHTFSVSVALFLSFPFFLFTSASAVIDPLTSRSALHKKYSGAYSLGDGYAFNPRDGWNTVNITDLAYKYSRSTDNPAENNASNSEGVYHYARSKKKSTGKKSASKSKSSSKISLLGGSVAHAIDAVWNSLKGVGKAEAVTITWYTGHDLLNPSCWSNGDWAPTDSSMACALTLDGWTSKPKCFKFLELCQNSKKCVYVRVVDTCAGCATGSRHVDLTKGAFGNLASIDEGVLSVQMRPATDPEEWFEDLWGPKVN